MSLQSASVRFVIKLECHDMSEDDEFYYAGKREDGTIRMNPDRSKAHKFFSRGMAQSLCADILKELKNEGLDVDELTVVEHDEPFRMPQYIKI